MIQISIPYLQTIADQLRLPEHVHERETSIKNSLPRSIAHCSNPNHRHPLNHNLRRLPHRPKRWRMARSGCRQVILGPANRITSRIRAFISGL